MNDNKSADEFKLKVSFIVVKQDSHLKLKEIDFYLKEHGLTGRKIDKV